MSGRSRSRNKSKKRRTRSMSVDPTKLARKNQLSKVILSCHQDLKDNCSEKVSRDVYYTRLESSRRLNHPNVSYVLESEKKLVYDMYMNMFPHGSRMVKSAADVSRENQSSSFRGVIARNALKQADSYGRIILNEMQMPSEPVLQDNDGPDGESDVDEDMGFTLVHVAMPPSKYPEPNLFSTPFLAPYHITLPVTDEKLELIVGDNHRGVFYDIENIPFAVQDSKTFEHEFVIIAYADSLDGNLILTSRLMEVLQQNRVFFVAAHTGKERADGLIDAFVMDFHHRLNLKLMPFVVVSSDHGFDTTLTTVSAQGRPCARIYLTGDPNCDMIYEKIVEVFPLPQIDHQVDQQRNQQPPEDPLHDEHQGNQQPPEDPLHDENQGNQQPLEDPLHDEHQGNQQPPEDPLHDEHQGNQQQ